MPNIESLKTYKNVHMVGIGGVSMSGIAEILRNWGISVTGSDSTQSAITDELNKRGIKVTIGNDIDSVKNADIVVYSAAISKDNPEIVESKKQNIKTMERADFLGEITKCYNNTVTIAGTHGKTTTTSMVSLSFLEAELDPSIQVGAILEEIGGNNRVGNSENFIIEACEYVESFLKFSPKSAIILNIDNDHLDYFKTFANVKKAFIKYVELLPEDGILVVNGDDQNCLDLQKHTKARCVTYGITNKHTDFFAVNIVFDENGFPQFDVYQNDKFYARIKLSVPGMHNVSNCLACIAMCHEYGISSIDIQNALVNFKGADRRFEYKGMINGAKVFDDYGHHPTEIIATAKSLMNKKYNKSWVVFQPHTYSRTKNLLDDFAKALLNFDNIIIVDIYAARETNTYGISSKDLVNKIQSFGTAARYIPDFNECVDYIKANVKPNDIVMTLGAGTVTKIGPMLVE